MELEPCLHCNRDVAPEPPAFGWKLLLGVFWAALIVIVPAMSLILGLNLVLVPVGFAMMLAIGTAARMATTWHCPDCTLELHSPANFSAAYQQHKQRMKARRAAEAARHAELNARARHRDLATVGRTS